MWLASIMSASAPMAEITFLRHRRVELSTMPADVFVRFLERKLTEHGIGKVVPDNDVLAQHSRHVITRDLTNKALEAIRRRRKPMRPRSNCLPICTNRLSPPSKSQLDIPWDFAVANIARKALR